MSITCEPFSPFNLEALAQENQFYSTSNCISAKIHFGVYLAYFIILALMTLGFSGVLLSRYLKRKTFKLNPYNKTVLCSIAYCFFKSVLMLMFLLGWNNRWRYLFQPLPMPFLMINATGILVEWFKAVRAVEIFNSTELTTRILSKFSLSVLSLNIVFSSSIFICAGILPIIFFESNPLALNWSFAFSQGLSGLTGMVFSIYMIYIGQSLVKSISPAKDLSGNFRLDAIEKKFKKFTFIFRQLCMNASTTAVGIPLWMGLSTMYGVGMHYFFYVYFFLLVPSEIGIIFILFWMVQRIKDNGSKNSQVSSSLDSGSKKKAHSVNSLKQLASSTTEDQNRTMDEQNKS